MESPVTAASRKVPDDYGAPSGPASRALERRRNAGDEVAPRRSLARQRLGHCIGDGPNPLCPQRGGDRELVR